jgi:hypothetical protein
MLPSAAGRLTILQALKSWGSPKWVTARKQPNVSSLSLITYGG